MRLYPVIGLYPVSCVRRASLTALSHLAFSLDLTSVSPPCASCNTRPIVYAMMESRLCIQAEHKPGKGAR